MIMNRAAVIDQLKATQQTLWKLLALLESSEAEFEVIYRGAPPERAA
jgi:hypothetical protein